MAGTDSNVRVLISSGSTFEEKYAYSRGVVQGDWFFSSGTTGYDYSTMKIPQSAVEQTRNIFETLGKALKEGGFELKDIVRIQVHATAAKYWDEAAPVVREYLKDIRPANTTVVCELMNSEMKIEIEATAFRG